MNRRVRVGVIAAALLAFSPALAAGPTPPQGASQSHQDAKAKGAMSETGKHLLRREDVWKAQPGSETDLILTAWAAG